MDDDVEELEELEVLEELEAVEESPKKPPPRTGRAAPQVRSAQAAPQAQNPRAGGPGAQAIQSACVSTIPSTRLFHSSFFPVLVINKEFTILYANPASKKFFTSFFQLGSNFFFDVFGKYFQVEDVRNIRAAVMKGDNGHSWRGIALIKSHEQATVYTRVYVFPAGIDYKNPKEFTIMFDDVTEENRKLLRGFFSSLLEASKLKDNDTGKHITRVNYYSDALAKMLYNKADYKVVDAEFIDNIGFLAAMHDVGKIGTPDDILNKEGPLSEFEWSIMQEHTKNGAFLLEGYPNPMAKEIALSHHEKWNGSGYPFKIEGEMIPLSARIVSIADVYDALRMKRSYKPGFTHEVAVNKIVESKGTQFDPKLVDIFLTIANEFNDIYERNKDID
ncbi:MAG: HD domain-containing protein [Spirochaetaceae bacterium]|jgi:putative two-component system response regulator|nr:HD domain-containing protein [Spirochaetaceae bacterium]